MISEMKSLETGGLQPRIRLESTDGKSVKTVNGDWQSSLEKLKKLHHQNLTNVIAALPILMLLLLTMTTYLVNSEGGYAKAVTSGLVN